MSFTTSSGLRRSTRLSKYYNSGSHHDANNVGKFEQLIDNIVEKKFNFTPMNTEERRYPIRDNTRISYSSFFHHVDESEQVDDSERVTYPYNLRPRKKVTFMIKDQYFNHHEDGEEHGNGHGDGHGDGHGEEHYDEYRTNNTSVSYCPLRSSNFISKIFNLK